MNSKQYIFVHGNLSCGKQWVVMDACCSYSIMHQMDGGIFWINCSKCKQIEQILEQLERLAIKAKIHEPTTISSKDILSKIMILNQNMRASFDKNSLNNSLIVLIDVQNSETLKAFDLNCKMIVTTRNKRVSELNSFKFLVIIEIFVDVINFYILLFII